MFKHLKYFSYFIIILNIQINLFYFQTENLKKETEWKKYVNIESTNYLE